MRIVWFLYSYELCKRKEKPYNMKKNILVLLALLLTNSLLAEDLIKKDSTNFIKIKEVVITASPKEAKDYRQLPLTTSIISQHDMQVFQVNSLKNITGIVPNLFIPDYGSKLTSAIYIRGIGSRINTPSVGLYVDNIPYIDKSAFDFNYSDIESIEVLRGPQSTLYGRNAMGGIIKLNTKSPFSYQGTDLKIGAGTYDNYSASLTHYHRISDKFAFSAGGFYEKDGGFFDNNGSSPEFLHKHKKADALSTGGGRIRSIWLPKDNLKFDLNVSYEYTDQGGYPYVSYDNATGKMGEVSTNRESNYYRGLLNAGLNISYQAKDFTLSAVTGFQNLKDRMFMDQDFTTNDMYTLTQKQKQNTLTEEITFRSNENKRYEWVNGAFGFYQSQKTDSPMNFEKDGIAMIQSGMDAGMAGLPIKITLTDQEMPVYGNYSTPALGAAIFHQSTYNDLFIKGLSATVGLRLDYEKLKIDHQTNATMHAIMTMYGQTMDASVPVDIHGTVDNDYLQLLPKFALKYDFKNNNIGNVYASASRGYRSGGYNFQMFSDFVEAQMMSGSSTPSVSSDAAIKDAITYKPEYTWSYEVGTHLSLLDKRVTADLAAFYMDTRDQQIVKFSDSGLGRMTVNAGRSASRGAEASIRAAITNAFSINAAYGYTHSTFKDYVANEKNEQQQIVPVNYDGNYVPMVPQNTFCLGAEYVFTFQNSLVNSLIINAQYSGVGKTYWTEKNDLSQNFYGIVNGKVGVVMKKVQIDVWARNLLDKSYATFGFESMGNTFMQKGRPMQAGIDLRYRF